ncbi:MAG: hypothetical protein RBT39_13585, partial [Azoarcus sp.]|nr:hypothetical protein [Azoarcus sp.]
EQKRDYDQLNLFRQALFSFYFKTTETTKTEIHYKNFCKNNRFPASTPFRQLRFAVKRCAL